MCDAVKVRILSACSAAPTGDETMAFYKQSGFLKHDTGTGFDGFHNPGVKAPFAGIYRCPGCGHEIAIAEGHVLPAQHPPVHTVFQGKIRWQLIVAADHGKF